MSDNGIFRIFIYRTQRFRAKTIQTLYRIAIDESEIMS